jgi:hypothetical protein
LTNLISLLRKGTISTGPWLLSRRYRGFTVAMGRPRTSLLYHSSNGSADVSKVNCYNIFSLNKEIELYLTRSDDGTPGPAWELDMGPTHACTPSLPSALANVVHLHTISSSHRTTEHCRLRAHRLPNHPCICCLHVGPAYPNHLDRHTHVRARDLVSMFNAVQWALIFKLVSPNFEERCGTKSVIA